MRPAAHACGRRRHAGRARRGVPARRRTPPRRLAGRRRALRGGVRPADGRAGRGDRRAAAAEPALGTVGPPRSRTVARHRVPRRAGPECRARVRRRDGFAGHANGCWPRTCRACWATPTSKPRTSAGTTARSGPCTTGTAWRGNRKRHSPARRPERSPACRRRRCRRSEVPPRSWRPTRTSAAAGSPRRSRRWRGRRACGRRLHNARWEALHGDRPVSW